MRASSVYQTFDMDTRDLSRQNQWVYGGHWMWNPTDVIEIWDNWSNAINEYATTIACQSMWCRDETFDIVIQWVHISIYKWLGWNL